MSKIAVFIDGASLYSVSRALQFDIDYLRLREFFQKRGDLVRMHYYAVLDDTKEHKPLLPLLDWLSYHGYKVAKKLSRKIRGSIAVDMAVDVLEFVHYVDHVYLVTRDADFTPLVEAAQRRGVRVTVVSTIASRPPILSDDLRRLCDDFLEIDSIKAVIGRNGGARLRHRDERDSVFEDDDRGYAAVEDDVQGLHRILGHEDA